MPVLNPSTSVSSAGTAAKRMWYGVYTASVVSTQDPLKKSRITLKVPQVLGTSTSNWAVPIGYEPVIPAVNSIVWAMFLGGDINQPLYLYASTTNTVTAVPGVLNVATMNGLTLTDSTLDDGTLTGNTTISSDTDMPDTDSSGISVTSADMGDSAGGSLDYTTTTGDTVSPVSWDSTGASVIGTVSAAAPGASSSVALTAETWHAMALINDWVDLASPSVQCQYRLTADNQVEIIGSLDGTSATTPEFFILPSNYVTSSQQMVPAQCTDVTAGNYYIQATTDGGLSVEGNSAGVSYLFHGWISLDA